MSDWVELSRLDALEQAALCARSEVTAEELWQACQARIAALNPLLRAAPIQNIAGCPAMSVPLYWSEQGEGLPIGAHFAAAPGQDALLLGLAYQLERARPWHDRWAPYSFPVLFGAD